MKQKTLTVLLNIIIFCVANIFAETVDIKIIKSDGTIILKKIDKHIKDWGISNTDKELFYITSIENLDALPELKSFEIQNISSITDYSFLAKAKKLRYLHLSCTLYDLSFIEQMCNLEYICISGWISESVIEKMEKTQIDFSKLKNINYIEFNLQGYSKVPFFINVPNKPFLNLNNNKIASISNEEYKLLEQYSIVSMQFSTITNNISERNKLTKLKIYFDPDDEIPASILKYTLGPWD